MEVAVKLAEANALVANVVVEIYIGIWRQDFPEVAVKLAEANVVVDDSHHVRLIRIGVTV
jgi:hypothetical protein